MSKKVIIFLCIVFIVCVVGVSISLRKDPFESLNTVQKVKVEIISRTIDAWYLDTKPLLARGLSGLPSLPENAGMFFVFDKNATHGFWMKDMFFPIDIIWIGEDFKVVHIEKNVSPDTFPTLFFPKALARFVLEVNAGFTDSTGLKIGAPVKLIK